MATDIDTTSKVAGIGWGSSIADEVVSVWKANLVAMMDGKPEHEHKERGTSGKVWPIHLVLKASQHQGFV